MRLHIPKTDIQLFTELVYEMLEDEKWAEHHLRLEMILRSFITDEMKAEILRIYYLTKA